MKKNVGSVDRGLRIFAGLVLIVWVLFANGPGWAWLGVIPLLTGLFSLCPLYKLLGINTKASK